MANTPPDAPYDVALPIGKNGAAVPGKMRYNANGDVTWTVSSAATALEKAGRTGDIGTSRDTATLFRVKKADGTYVWEEASKGKLNDIARQQKITVAEVTSNLYSKDKKTQNTLNTAARIGKVGTDGSAGGTGGVGVASTGGAVLTTQKDLQSQVVAVYRDNYGDFKYPLTLANSTQDCVKFLMYRYVPKQFNATLLGDSTNNLSGELFSEPKLADKDKKPLGSVILPIQSPASDTNTVVWGDNSMDAVTANAAALALSLITGGESGGGVDPESGAQKIQEAAGQLGQLAGITLAGKAATGQEGSGLYTRLTGAIINPNIELLFTAPALRTFSFTFKLSAREAAEAVEIRKIIRFFKQGMSAKTAKSNLFLVSPNIFEIHYLYRGGKTPVDHPWMNRFKTCALQSCSVNYTPEGNYATYDGGSMTSYEISLNFGELTPIYDKDYDAIDKNLTEIGY